ncbi:MAG: Ribosomal RNA large subunit methyltransferase L [Bacteroidetes bacterium ADurb.Bin302]|jgi:putative N6-adenine-specific DNA methylase|nr:MAG: Ribosomal RNA large subunit methyltransferase L [Bacteroidetes bacterium ADurb.Bin302]
MNDKMNLVAKTFQGLESVLAKELENIGAQNVRIERRAVLFEGTTEIMYKANLHCRTALRILKPIAVFQAKDAEEIYNNVKKIAWEKIFDVKQSFLIEATVYSEVFTHSRFATYKTKDAIVDYFQEKVGKRPSISVSNPDIFFNLHISHNTCTLSLDSSGGALYKRGYRVAQTEAPINEVLAAGMILLSGWNGQCDFLDPMCGSGTIPIEAAMIALNIPPGVFRKNFAFEKWLDFDEELFDKLYNDDSGEKKFNHKIYASDISSKAISVADANIKNAGFTKYISTQVIDFANIPQPKEKTFIITNPPYGERIGGDIDSLYGMIGTTLKHKYADTDAWIISSNKRGFDQIGLKPNDKIMLQNAEIDCQYRHYHLFPGKLKTYKSANKE